MRRSKKYMDASDRVFRSNDFEIFERTSGSLSPVCV